MERPRARWLLGGAALLVAGCAEQGETPEQKAPRGAASELRYLLSESGSLQGHELRLSRADGSAELRLSLPREAFAEAPYGGAVLFGGDDGSASSVALWTADGGLRQVMTTAEVVRAGALGPDGRQAFVYTVERGSRRALGVLRVSLDGGPGERVVEPIPEAPPQGPHQSSKVLRSIDGDAVALQSCNELVCRTRVLDLVTGRVSHHDTEGQGLLLGLTRDELIVRVSTHSLPADLLRIDRRTGESTTLARAAGVAHVFKSPDGGRVVGVEGGRGDDRRLSLLDATSGAAKGSLPLVGGVTRSVEAPAGFLSLRERPDAARWRWLSLENGRSFGLRRAGGEP